MSLSIRQSAVLAATTEEFNLLYPSAYNNYTDYFGPLITRFPVGEVRDQAFIDTMKRVIDVREDKVAVHARIDARVAAIMTTWEKINELKEQVAKLEAQLSVVINRHI